MWDIKESGSDPEVLNPKDGSIPTAALPASGFEGIISALAGTPLTFRLQT